jgi:acyl-CoA synthetase (AMP-forming)/AMP-acid ligase II
MLLGDILELNALKGPDRLALVVGERSFSYAEMRDRCRRLESALRGLTAPGERVAILAENIVEYVDAYYGVPSAGLALVLLNYRLNPHELAWIINDSDATVLIVESSYLDAVLEVREEWPKVRHVIVVADTPSEAPGVIDYNELVGSADATASGPGPDEDDVAWQLYTSGTTGRPKGAMLTHRNLVTAMLNAIIAYGVKAEDRAMLCFPMCHVSGYLVTQNHLAGASMVLMRSYSPETFMQLVEKHQINSTGLAPTMMTTLLRHPRIDDYDLSSLESIGYGAAAMPVEVLKAAIDRFGPVVWSGFGMTELGGNVLTHPISAHLRAVQGEEHLLASCGLPMTLAAVRVVDDDMRELPPGEVGEIVIQGEQLLQGYANLPEATEEAFRGGWFHTGDMARRDEEGFFYIVDRMKDMIITGGENVYSREVEEVLYAHPAVADAAVIGLPDQTWGERVTAVVTLRPGAQAGAGDIISSCRQRLAGFKTPKQVVFVDELPKTVSGKILKRELRDRLGASGEGSALVNQPE